MATLRAIPGALRATLDRFSPGSIRRRAEKAGVMARILPALQDAALWRNYEREYVKVKNESDEAFMEVFAREFRKAYESASCARGSRRSPRQAALEPSLFRRAWGPPPRPSSDGLPRLGGRVAAAAGAEATSGARSPWTRLTDSNQTISTRQLRSAAAERKRCCQEGPRAPIGGATRSSSNGERPLTRMMPDQP